MRYGLIVLLLVLLMSMTPHSGTEEPLYDSRPIAVGFGERERYILYENGYVRSLGNLNYIGRIDIDVDLASLYLIDFEVISDILYLYAYRSLNNTSGETKIVLFDIKSGGEIFDKTYRFSITNRVVTGDMVLMAIASKKGFAVMKANSTHSSIDVYEVINGSVTQVYVFDGSVATFIHRYNDTLLAAVPSTEYGVEGSRKVPKVVDIFENRSLFSLPSLIPVLALAHPFIQVFNRGGIWECYVTVYNPIRNRIEHYIVLPESYDLIEYHEVIVSPYMDYAIIKYENMSKIMFKDNTNITVNHRLSIVPQGTYIAFSSINGVLDIDVKNKALLIKIVENNRAKIVYVEREYTAELLEIDASEADKTKGFYGAISNGKVYVIINNTLTTIELKDLSGKTGHYMWITWILLIIVILMASIFTFVTIRKYCKNLRLNMLKNLNSLCKNT